MKIRLLNDTALRTLKREIRNNVTYYNGGDDEWIKAYLHDRKNTFESKIDAAEVELLVPDSDDRKKYDGENAARLHSAYPGINAAIATDERLWATLCHGQFYDFMKARWPAVAAQKGQTPEGIIEQRYFFYRADPRKSQERNGLARLWLSAAMTFDASRSNPYELTDVMLQNTNFVFHLFGRKFSSNKDVLQGTLEAILLLENETGKPVGRVPLSEYGRRLNLIGGVSSLDLWDKEEATRNAYDFMKPLM